MKYAKISFGLAIGWYAGKYVFDAVIWATETLIHYYVPEKYWNEKYTECTKKSAQETEASNEAKMKIGFCPD